MKEYIVRAFEQKTIDSLDAHNAPELVRCKDCKWRNTKACFCKAPGDVRDDWFCSEGEKR